MKRMALGLWAVVLMAHMAAGKPPQGGGGELITCELTVPPKAGTCVVSLSQAECDQMKGTYHYRLWLPPAYAEDPSRRWPCLFIASPSGSATMGPMAEWLKANQFIVVQLVESKNGSWLPIIGNFLAAHDDVVQRVRVQEGLKFATGFSGGARASSVSVQLRPGFAGLIMQGAGASYDDGGRYLVAGINQQPGLFCTMIMGEADSNRKEVERMQKLLGADKLATFAFDGGHTWAPAEQFAAAMTWIESRMIATGAGKPAVRVLGQQRVNTQLVELAELTEPWQRFKKIEAILALAQKTNLQTDPLLGPKLGAVLAERQQLLANTTVQKEAAAAQALRNAEQSRARSSPSMFVMTCQNIVRLYPGTEAAARAAELAQSAQ